MKKILIIACYFPPAGGGGVQRTLKFVKYLPNFGWTPIVLTTKKQILPIEDITLLDDLPPDVKIVRTLSLEPKTPIKLNLMNHILYWVSVPDLSIWWLPFAVYEGLCLIKSESIDIIYVTGNPFSSYLIGCILKFLAKKPLIIDFRDAWILDPRRSIKIIMLWRDIIEKFLFNICVKYSDKIILATNSMCEDFKNRFKNIRSSNDFIAITNGFDDTDLNKIVCIEKNSDFFNIVYTGTLQGGSRDSTYLFKALSLIKKDNYKIYSHIRLYLVGNISNNYKLLLTQYGLHDCVLIKGYVPHNESLGYLKMADVLVFIMETQKNVRQITSGKIFEYIAFNKPILALASIDSDAADIIKESGLGIFVNPIDEYEIFEMLLQLYNSWKNNQLLITISPENVSKYTRKEITKKLALCLDQLA